jgi:hypothetical protein
LIDCGGSFRQQESPAVPSGLVRNSPGSLNTGGSPSRIAVEMNSSQSRALAIESSQPIRSAFNPHSDFARSAFSRLSVLSAMTSTPRLSNSGSFASSSPR